MEVGRGKISLSILFSFSILSERRHFCSVVVTRVNIEGGAFGFCYEEVVAW